MNEKDGLHINELGTKRWFKDGKLHRDDGPAVIWSDDEQYWYKNDERYEPSAHEIMAWKMNEKEQTKNKT